MSENRERDAHMQALRQALGDGECSGSPEAFDFDVFIARKRARYGGQAAGCAASAEVGSAGSTRDSCHDSENQGDRRC